MADNNEYVTLSLRDSKPEEDESIAPGGSGELHVSVTMQQGAQAPDYAYKLWVVFLDGGGLEVGNAAVNGEWKAKVKPETSWNGGRGLQPDFSPDRGDKNTALLADWTPKDVGVTEDSDYGTKLGWIIKYKAKSADKYDFSARPEQIIEVHLRLWDKGDLIGDASIDRPRKAIVKPQAPAFVAKSAEVVSAYKTPDNKQWVPSGPQIELRGKVAPVTAAKTLSVRWKIGSGSWVVADNVSVSNGNIGPWTVRDPELQREGAHDLELQVAPDSKSSWSPSEHLTVNVDATAPTLSNLLIEITAKGEARLTGKITDTGSGVASWEGTWPNAKGTTGGSIDMTLGKTLDFSKGLSLRAKDNVGNVSADMPAGIAANTLLQIQWNLPTDKDLNLGEAFLYNFEIRPKFPATLPPLDVKLELPTGAVAKAGVAGIGVAGGAQWVHSEPSWTGGTQRLLTLPAFENAFVEATANVSPQAVELVGKTLQAGAVVLESPQFNRAVSQVQPSPWPTIYAAPPRFEITSPDDLGWVMNSKAVSFSGVFQPPLQPGKEVLFEFDVNGKGNWQAVKPKIEQRETFEVHLPAGSFKDRESYEVFLRAKYKDDSRPVTRSGHVESTNVLIDDTIPTFHSDVSVSVDDSFLTAKGTVFGPPGDEAFDPIDTVKVAWGGSDFRELDADLERTADTTHTNAWRFSLKTELKSVKDLLLTPLVTATTHAKVSQAGSPRFLNSKGLIDVKLQVDDKPSDGKGVAKSVGDNFSVAIVTSMKLGIPKFILDMQISDGIARDKSKTISVTSNGSGNNINVDESWDLSGSLAVVTQLHQGDTFTIKIPLKIIRKPEKDEKITVSVEDLKKDTFRYSSPYYIPIKEKKTSA